MRRPKPDLHQSSAWFSEAVVSGKVQVEVQIMEHEITK